MKIDKRNPRHWWLLLRQGIYSLVAMAYRLVAPTPAKPRVILYGHQLSGNLKALYEEWQRHFSDDYDCYFLSLDPQYSDILEAEGVQVLRCGSLGDMLRVGTSFAVITDHGLHAMSVMVGRTGIRFIDVWHGIPYKGFTPDYFRVQHRYDEVWVSSPLLEEVYVEQFGFPAAIVRDLGYARVDKLFRGDPANPSLRRQLALPDDVRIALYAPTWKQEDSGRDLFPFGQSQDAFLAALNAVCAARNVLLVVRSHLNATISARDYDNVRYCSMKDFPDAESLLQETDVLICDWSSISFDYLALDRPAIFLEVEPPFANGFSLGPEYRYGYIAATMEELCGQLAAILDDPAGYTASQAGTHKRITEAAYGRNIDGQAAWRQWRRLGEMRG